MLSSSSRIWKAALERLGTFLQQERRCGDTVKVVRMRGKSDEDVQEEEQMHTEIKTSFAKEGVWRNLPRRRAPTQLEQSKLHQTGSSTMDAAILISTEIRKVETIDKLE